MLVWSECARPSQTQKVLTVTEPTFQDGRTQILQIKALNLSVRNCFLDRFPIFFPFPGPEGPTLSPRSPGSQPSQNPQHSPPPRSTPQKHTIGFLHIFIHSSKKHHRSIIPLICPSWFPTAMDTSPAITQKCRSSATVMRVSHSFFHVSGGFSALAMATPRYFIHPQVFQP